MDSGGGWLKWVSKCCFNPMQLISFGFFRLVVHCSFAILYASFSTPRLIAASVNLDASFSRCFRFRLATTFRILRVIDLCFYLFVSWSLARSSRSDSSSLLLFHG